MDKRLAALVFAFCLCGCGSDVGPNDPVMTKQDLDRREATKYTPEEAAARAERPR